MTITAASSGFSSIVVSATDEQNGVSSDTFKVTVNLSPIVLNTIPNHIVQINSPPFIIDIDSAKIFSDPDGDELSYTATSSDSNKVRAYISGGSILTLIPKARGKVTITVTARDNFSGFIQTYFTFTVNEPPIITNAIPDQIVTLGRILKKDLNTSFSDLDGNALTYTAISSDTNIIQASISKNILSLKAIFAGNVTIQIFADDNFGGVSSDTFLARVNRSPELANPIQDQILIKGGIPFTRDLVSSSPVFVDPDGDTLTFDYTPKSSPKIQINLAENILTVAPRDTGSEVIKITADDNKGGLIIEEYFTVHVRLLDYPETLSLIKTINFPLLSSALNYRSTDYQLIGLPGASNRSITDILQAGQPDKDWQFFWDNGQDADYLIKYDGSSIFLFSVGRGFWMIKKGYWEINTSVQSATLNSELAAELPVHEGWNIVTNPFLSTVSWSAVTTINSIFEPIWQYEGILGFTVTDNFEPYVGYYFYNKSSSKTLIKIPYILTPKSSQVISNSENSVDWKVNITLNSGNFSDNSTSFGAAQLANCGADIYDFHKPRTINRFPSVFFRRPAWDEKYSLFATDVRPEIENYEKWELEVHALPKSPSQLIFSNISKVPKQLDIFLIHEPQARIINLRSDTLYRFTSNTELNNLSIIVGKKDTVLKILNTVTIPKNFKLGPNFPNPFNLLTSIVVACPINSEVKLEIYNILGEKIRKIYKGTLEAGRHCFYWDGKNTAGDDVAAGVYLCVLTTSNKLRLLDKMILLK